MSLETKALSDFQNVISCEMDLQDALAGGSLDGYAIRDTNLSRTSFENRMLKNVLIHRTSMPSLRMDSMDANAIQCTACNLRGCSMRDANIDGWNMLNCHAIECRFEDTLYKTGTSSNPIWSTVISIAQKSLKHSSNRIICMALRSKTPSSHKSNSPIPKWAMLSFRAPTSRAP